MAPPARRPHHLGPEESARAPRDLPLSVPPTRVLYNHTHTHVHTRSWASTHVHSLPKPASFLEKRTLHGLRHGGRRGTPSSPPRAPPPPPGSGGTAGAAGSPGEIRRGGTLFPAGKEGTTHSPSGTRPHGPSDSLHTEAPCSQTRQHVSGVDDEPWRPAGRWPHLRLRRKITGRQIGRAHV